MVTDAPPSPTGATTSHSSLATDHRPAGGLTETELTVPRDFDRGLVSGQGRYVLLVSRDEATLGFYDLEAVVAAAGG